MKIPAIFKKNKKQESINITDDNKAQSQNTENNTPTANNRTDTSKPTTQSTTQQVVQNNINTATNNTETNNSEFAQRTPLLTAKELKKIGLGCISILAFFMVLLAIFLIYKSVTRKDVNVQAEKHLACQNESCIEVPGAGTNECETDNDCKKTEETEVPSYAYIKDKTEIYTATIDGKTKKEILSTNDDNQYFSTLTWKTKNNLTYSKCAKDQKTECSIQTLDLTSRSITPEIIKTNSTNVRKLKFNKEKSYFAFIGQNRADTKTIKNLQATNLNLSELTFYLKTGAVKTALNSMLTTNDPSNTQNRIIFTNDSKYVIFSAVKLSFQQDRRKREVQEVKTPYIYIYQTNGTLFDKVENATDPFLVDKNTIGFSKNGAIMYKKIGEKLETPVTIFKQSYNPTISFDKKNIAYWKNEGGFSDVLLGIYDIDLGIHRNILRGVILPTWVTNNSVVGIKADGCIGQACLLYEFQTTSLVLVNIENGDVSIVDQGKSISNIDFLEE